MSKKLLLQEVSIVKGRLMAPLVKGEKTFPELEPNHKNDDQPNHQYDRLIAEENTLTTANVAVGAVEKRQQVVFFDNRNG